MEWWSVFRKIRKAIFIFIALVSLVWAGVLTFYLAREWNHFNILQRTVVISMISVNIVTLIMQYLMIVLPFKIWRDFVRMLFLLTIHIATTVLFTLFGPNFSCKIFSSKSLCEDVDLVFLVCSWAITGLLVGYTAYLCIMSRVPRPIPQITPNLLISSSDSSRRGSMSSISSATHLLRQDRSIPAPAPPRSLPSASPQTTSPQTRMVPKKLFVVNGLPSPDSASPATATPRSSGLPPRPRGSYGAMGTPRSMTASPAPTFSTQSTVMTARSPKIPAAAWDNGSNTGFAPKRVSRREALPLPNPFMDPVSRPGTADTAYTAMSYASDSSLFTRGDMQPMGGRDMLYLSPFHIPPLAFDAENVGRPPVSPGAESIYSLYSSDSPRDDDSSNIDLEKGSIATMTHTPNLHRPNATVRLTMSFPPRMHTATPHSIHSVAPSVDWTSEQQRTITPVNNVPPPVHARAASDPVYRPYTASPRMIRPQQPLATYAAPPDNTVLLPNPFPMVGSANVRRYASIGHTRAQLSLPGSVSHADVRNAHLQAAMGRAPPRTQTYPVAVGVARAPTKKVGVSKAEWKQLVMNAASAR